MENKKNGAASSASRATQTSPIDLEKDEELDQILEDLVSLEIDEAAGYDRNDTMACLRNESYSVEQIAVLVDIWATKFENKAQKTSEAQARRNEYLKMLVKDTNSQRLLGGTLKESVKKLNDMLLAERDCGLCKLMISIKKSIHHCTDNVTCNEDTPVHCPFKVTGVTYLALKELKDEVVELHKQRCSCPDCARFLPRYNELACYLSLHEQIHVLRRDIGFSK